MRFLLKTLGRFIDVRTVGIAGALRGLRTGDQRSLLTGAALLALSWLGRPPRRRLVYRREIPPGSSVLVRYGRQDQMPQVEITRAELPPPT